MSLGVPFPLTALHFLPRSLGVKIKHWGFKSDVDVWIVVERIVNDQGSNNATKVQHPKKSEQTFLGI
jgi:hypothetical protein